MRIRFSLKLYIYIDRKERPEQKALCGLTYIVNVREFLHSDVAEYHWESVVAFVRRRYHRILKQTGIDCEMNKTAQNCDTSHLCGVANLV